MPFNPNTAIPTPIGQPGRNKGKFNPATVQLPGQSMPAQNGRGLGGVASDLGASFAGGANALLKIGGDLYGLTTGDMDNWASDYGKLGNEYWNNRKSPYLKSLEADRKAKIDAAEGTLAKAGTALWETISSPSLISSFMFEQVPMLLPIAGVGRGAGMAAQAAKFGTKAAGRIATGAAVGAGGAMQGADAGSQAYEQLTSLPEAVWEHNSRYKSLRAAGSTHDQAMKSVAVELSRDAAIASGIASVGTNLLPGARILERALAGVKMPASSMAMGALKGFLGESLQEGLEEGSGAFLANRATAQIDPSQDLMEGVGEATGLGAAFGPFGAVAGAVNARSQRDIKRILSSGSVDDAIKRSAEAVNLGELADINAYQDEAIQDQLDYYKALPYFADFEKSLGLDATVSGDYDSLTPKALGGIDFPARSLDATVETPLQAEQRTGRYTGGIDFRPSALAAPGLSTEPVSQLGTFTDKGIDFEAPAGARVVDRLAAVVEVEADKYKSKFPEDQNIPNFREEEARIRKSGNTKELKDAVAALGGIGIDFAKSEGVMDLNQRQGFKWLFTKKGKSFDDMREALAQDGFDFPRANDLVAALTESVNGQRDHYAPAGIELQNLYEWKQQEEVEKQKFDAGEWQLEAMEGDYHPRSEIHENILADEARKAINAGVPMVSVGDILREFEAQQNDWGAVWGLRNAAENTNTQGQAIQGEDGAVQRQANNDDGEIPEKGNRESQAEGLRALGFSEDEIAQELGDFALEQPSEQSLRDQEALVQKSADEKKTAEAKADADAAVGDFVLSGSDSQVDQAEARGQSNMFDARGRVAEKGPRTIEQVKAEHAKVEITDSSNFSKENMEKQFALSREAEAIQIATVKKMLDAGDAPVFKDGSVYSTVTPSTREPGSYQITYYNDSGALSDTTIKSLDALGNELRLIKVDLLPKKEADEVMARVVKGEAEYQKKAKSAPLPKTGKEVRDFKRGDIVRTVEGSGAGMRISPARFEVVRTREKTAWIKGIDASEWSGGLSGKEFRVPFTSIISVGDAEKIKNQRLGIESKEVSAKPETAVEAGARVARATYPEKGEIEASDTPEDGLTVEFNGKRYPVKSIKEAQSRWNQFREDAAKATGLGVSGTGNGVFIYRDGVPIARISYNGRVWSDKSEDFNPPGGKLKKAQGPAIAAPASNQESIVKKVAKQIVGKQEINQLRAKAGGEYGPNGEWYEGGKFIATTELPKRTRQWLEKTVRQPKVLVEAATNTSKAKYSEPRIGQFPIQGGIVMGWGGINHLGEVNKGWMEYHDIENSDPTLYAELIKAGELFRSGERWVKVEDFPRTAGISDIARMIVNGMPVPQVAIDHFDGKVRDNILAVQKAYSAQESKPSQEPKAIESAPAVENKAVESNVDQEKSDLAEATAAIKELTTVLKKQVEAKPVPAAEVSPLTSVKTTIEKMYDGGLTVEEFRAAFQTLQDNTAEIKAELQKMTKQALLDDMGGSRAYYLKNDKKDRVVNGYLDDLAADFTSPSRGGAGISYVLGAGDPAKAYQNAVKKKVDEITQEDLDAFAEKVAEGRKEREADRAEKLQGIENPQTADDYKRILGKFMQEDGAKNFLEARAMLPLDQRIHFDRLAAKETRDKRNADKNDKKARLQTSSATTAGEIIETKHTKKGTDLFVIQLSDRIEREEYNKLNSSAKKLGGHYSSYRGGGAIPGFTFTERENAEAFQKLVGGDTEQAQEIAQARRDAFQDDKSQSAVERLREMADTLEERGTDSLNQDRKANTDRRARMAASAEAKAQATIAMAKTMRNVADAIESGNADFLDQVRTKAQIEMLDSFIYVAKSEEAREKFSGSYDKQQDHMRSKPTAETAEKAEFPRYVAWRSDLAKLGRQLQDLPGTMRMGDSLLKLADDVTAQYTKWAKENLRLVRTFKRSDGSVAAFPTKKAALNSIFVSGFKGDAIPLQIKKGEHAIVMSPSAAQKHGLWPGQEDTKVYLSQDFATELVTKLNRKSVSVPWILDAAHDKRKRLSSMNIETAAEFRAMMQEYIASQEQQKQPDKVKELERKMVGRRNDGLDFFPTPAELASEMIETAGIEEGMSILEPSAGMGHIADQIRQAGFEPDVVEISGDRRELLEAKGYNLVDRDFFDVTEKYDRIIMNPPFSDRRDFAHVQHAYTLLKPGGRLVAIVGEGVFFGSDKKAQDFRDWFESVGGTDEKLAEGTFQDPSLPVTTGVNARMIVIDKGPTSDVLASTLVAEGKTSGMSVADVTAAIAKPMADMKQQFDLDVYVVKSVRDMPADALNGVDLAKRYRGAFHDGAIYLFADNLQSPRVALMTLAHELVGHKGVLEGISAKGWSDIKKTIDTLRRMGSKTTNQIWAEVERRYGNESLETKYKEFLAVAAEKRVLQTKMKRLWEQVKAELLRILKSLGFTQPFSDSEIEIILSNSERYLRESGEAFQAASGSLASEPAPVFYSALLESIKTAKGAPNKAPGKLWKQWLDGRQKSGEFRQAERDWLGVDAWLDGRESTTRADLEAFIDAHQVEVKDVVLGDDSLRDDSLRKEAVKAMEEDGIEDPTDAQITEYLNEYGNDLIDPRNGVYPGDTKHAEHVLPGGKDYRELLLTWPEKPLKVSIGDRRPPGSEYGNKKYEANYEGKYLVDGVEEYPFTVGALPGRITYWPKTFGYKGEEQSGKWIVDSEFVQNARFDTKQEAIAHIEQDALSGNFQKFRKDSFKSGHWSEPNVLAHVRFNERTDADGNRVLFIEEIQSDMHQKGRKYGYAQPLSENERERLKNVRTKLGMGLSKVDYLGFENSSEAASAIREYDDWAERWGVDDPDIIGLGNEYRALAQRDRDVSMVVPNAPFKNTDEWAMLAFKRMVRHAVENGIDRIAWTTGDQQVDRYDLSKQIGILSAAKLADGDYAISASGPRGGDIPGLRNKRVKESELENFVGKELAEKIINKKGGRVSNSGARIYSGLDLKVGGEGMKGFYDQILPAAVNKWAKKFGGRVGSVEIATADGEGKRVTLSDGVTSYNERKRETQPSLTITPAMRDAALQGLPLFSAKEQTEHEQAVRKGLDMSTEARMERAREAGFDTSTVYYHGSGYAFWEDRDAPGLMAQNSDYGIPAVSLTDDIDTAKIYARMAGGEDGAVGEFFVRGRIHKNHSVAFNEAKAHAKKNGLGWNTESIDKYLIEKGYAGVFIEDLGEIRVYDPKNIKHVDAAFDPDFAESSNILFSAEEENTSPGLAEIADRVLATPVKSKIKDKITRTINEHKADWKLWFRQGAIDEFASIADYEIARYGHLLDAKDSAYKAAAFSKNSNNVLEVAMHTGAVRYVNGSIELVDGSKGLIGILEALADKGLVREWELWAGAVRAKRLMAEGKEKNYTQADIDTVLGAITGEKLALFRDVQSEWIKFNKQTLDFAQAAGLINPEERAVWEKDDYVPFHRVSELGEEAKKIGRKGGLSGQTSRIQRLTGGVEKISIVESMVRNTAHLIDASMKNVAMQRTIALAEEEGVVTKVSDSSISEEEARERLEALGVEYDDQHFLLWKSLLEKHDARHGTVTVSVNGKTVRYIVHDPMLLRSMTALGQTGVEGIMKILRMPKRLLTEMVTADPSFSLRNFIRDTLSTYVTVHGVKRNPIADAIRGVVSAYKDSDTIRAMRAQGVGGGGFYDTSPDGARAHLDKLEGKGKLITNVGELWQAYRRILGTTELANRDAVYKATLKQEGASKAEAAYQAMDVLNFSRHGEWKAVRILIELVPFMNARIQGIDRLSRGAKEGTAEWHQFNKDFVMKGAILTAATLALLAKNWDDDDYWDLEEWERDTYYHFFVGGEHYRMPKPFEVGALFSTVPERMFEQFRDDADMKLLGGRMLHMMADTFAFDPTPQFVKPALEVGRNKSGFTGRSILTQGMQFASPEAQYNPYTSKSMIELAEAMPDSAPDWMRSPVRLQHLVRGYFGTLGGYVLMASDSVVRNFANSPARPEARMRDVPVIQSFVRDGAGGNKQTGRLYDMAEAVNEIYASIKKYREEGRTDKAKELLEESREQLKARITLNRAVTRMSNISSQMRKIYDHPSMSPAEKRRRIDELTVSRNEFAKLIEERFRGVF